MSEFAELIAATNYSFLRGASHPSDMVGRALHRLVEQGYVAVERHQFRILDSAGLQREADGQR